MASIPNASAYGKITSYNHKRMDVIFALGQVVIIHLDFVVVDNRLRNTQRFEEIIAVDDQAVFGIARLGIMVKMIHVLAAWVLVEPHEIGEPFFAFFTDVFWVQCRR